MSVPLDTGATACCDMRAEDAHTFEGGMADVDPPISLRPCQGQVAQGRGRMRIAQFSFEHLGRESRNLQTAARPSATQRAEPKLARDPRG